MVTNRPALRAHQLAAIACLESRPDQRLVLWHATGAGKTRTAIACLGAARRVLVVCPAIARPVWLAEFARWAPGRAVAAVRYGRVNKSLTEARYVERETAYGCNTQIVSYDLLPHVAPTGWDFVVFDEAHALRSPSSGQSCLAAKLMRVNPGAAALALTATLVPKEVADCWNVLETLWPGWYRDSHATRGGEPSYLFRKRFGLREECEYATRGFKYSGFNPERGEELAVALSPFVHRVTDVEVAAYAPPLDARTLVVDDGRSDYAVAVEWMVNQARERKYSIGVFSHTRELARRLVTSAGRLVDTRDYRVFHLDGAQTVEARAAALTAMREHDGPTLLVATIDSLSESVSLSHVKDALVLEWQATPLKAIQFLGRFARADSTTFDRTRVEYVTRDDARAAMLVERLAAVAAVAAEDAKGARLRELFAAHELTDDDARTMFTRMMATARPSRLTEDGDDDG